MISILACSWLLLPSFVSLHLFPFTISILGCSWLPLPPCLPSFAPLHDLHSGLLLAAAAALSPKLVSLHDLHSGLLLAAPAAFSHSGLQVLLTFANDYIPIIYSKLMLCETSTLKAKKGENKVSCLSACLPLRDNVLSGVYAGVFCRSI